MTAEYVGGNVQFKGGNLQLAGGNFYFDKGDIRDRQIIFQGLPKLKDRLGRLPERVISTSKNFA